MAVELLGVEGGGFSGRVSEVAGGAVIEAGAVVGVLELR